MTFACFISASSIAQSVPALESLRKEKRILYENQHAIFFHGHDTATNMRSYATLYVKDKRTTQIQQIIFPGKKISAVRVIATKDARLAYVVVSREIKLGSSDLILYRIQRSTLKITKVLSADENKLSEFGFMQLAPNEQSMVFSAVRYAKTGEVPGCPANDECRVVVGYQLKLGEFADSTKGNPALGLQLRVVFPKLSGQNMVCFDKEGRPIICRLK